MLSELIQIPHLFSILYTFDLQLAIEIKEKKCPFCGDILDWANYQRKPRGHLCQVSDQHLVQFSLCCRNDNCRRRTQPPSSKFFGCKIYWGCVIMIVMALIQNHPKDQSIKQLQDLFDISHHTIMYLCFAHSAHNCISEWHLLAGHGRSTNSPDHRI